MIKQLLQSLILFSLIPLSFADLVSLEEAELGGVSGAGIGIVLEDFAFEAGVNVGGVAGGNRLDISGFKTSPEAGSKDVVLSISQFYIAGDKSNEGASVIGNGVNLGRLTHPYNIELIDGDTIGIDQKAVLEFSAPSRTGTTSLITQTSIARPRTCDFGRACTHRNQEATGFNLSPLSSRASELVDLGIRFDIKIGTANAQSLQAHATGLALDGSRIRLWSSASELVGNVAINLYADDLTLFAADSENNNRGHNVVFDKLAIEAELGYGTAQPLAFSVSGTGNFNLQLGESNATGCAAILKGNCSGNLGSAGFSDFYNNGPSINVFVENVRIGATREIVDGAFTGNFIGGRDFGSTTVSNLQFQYLEVSSHDL